MKKPPTPIIFGVLLILMLSYIWWWANKNSDAPLTDIQSVPPLKTTPHAKNDLTQEMPDAKPTLTNMTDKQRQFSQQVQELIAATTECRKDIEALFPVEGLEGTSKTYKNISQFQDVTGVPMYHDVTANAIILYPTPNYNSDEGGEMYVSRMPTRFTTSDTTKKAGIPEMFHEYLAIRPAYFYCLANGLKQVTGIGNEMLRMEEKIKRIQEERKD